MGELQPFLQALTYADSAYPSGRYTLSHGLEGLVQAGRVRGTQQVTDVLLDHLRYTAAPGDGVSTAVAVMTDDITTLIALDHELAATKVTGELRRASTRVGRQLLHVTAAFEDRLGHDQPDVLRDYAAAVAAKDAPGNQAVAAGLIHASHGLDAGSAVATELTGLAVGWAGAALRLRQCDHIGAQVAITAAHPVIDELAGQTVRTATALLGSGGEHPDWRLLGRASPGSDLASAAHESAPARLFMS